MQINHDLIMQAKKKLGDENAVLIFKELGVEDYDERNLRCCCPFHEEKTPSFIYNAKAYNFKCFGCGRSVDIIDAFILNGSTYIGAVKKLFDLADIKYSFGELGVKTKSQYKYPHAVPVNDKSRVEKYMAARKISRATLDLADVREDKDGNIVWNYYDSNNVLTMVKYRSSRKVNKGENKCWCQTGASTAPLLFNMNRVNTTSPLLICEGEPDCLTAIEAGFPNAVSVPFGAGNFHWIEENYDWLEQFDSIIICSDNDEAGLKMQKECTYRLGSWRTKVVDIPTDLKLPNGRQVKDLNEVLYIAGKEKVLELILQARDCPVPGVIDFSDIQDIDLDQIGGIKTGIRPLDKYLMRLFCGTLTILTGVNGGGKSSFLNQIIISSLEDNKNVFLYSGELPNFQTKNWLNSVIAGQRNTEEKRSDESVYYKVYPTAKKKIEDYYRGRLFVYEDGKPNTVSALLKTMEDSVRKYGTKLLIVDNLTAINLECNDDNKYEKQAEFVSNLISLAVKFDVVVILVVHPHKIETMRRLTKMDVQGLSAITDLAHRVISLYRVSEADHRGEPKKNGNGWVRPPIKEDVIIDILKDRILGYEGGSVNVYYDRPSRRFFTNLDDLDKQYSWDKNQYGNRPLPYPPKQLLEPDTPFD